MSQLSPDLGKPASTLGSIIGLENLTQIQEPTNHKKKGKKASKKQKRADRNQAKAAKLEFLLQHQGDVIQGYLFSLSASSAAFKILL